MGFSDKHFDFESIVHCDEDSCVLHAYNNSFFPDPPPTQVEAPIDMFSPSHKVQRLTVLALAISSALAFFFLLLTYYIILLRFRAFLRRRRSLLSPNPVDPPPQTPRDDDRDPVHHVWYIRTVGLDGPTIDSIAVCEYKPGEGLVDDTDCTVCLAEFEEGDLLRLLPKCSHAFHVPCIDRWLRAHVNCPLCRAPIVCAAREDENRDGSSSDAAEQAVLVGEEDGSRENRIGFLQDLGLSSSSPSGGESERGLVNSAGEENWVTIDLNEDDGFHEQQQQQHVRRSVSMDASAMAALMATDRKTNIADCTGKETACATVASSSPKKGPDGFDRCQSANGMKFFLPRFARGRSVSILPL